MKFKNLALAAVTLCATFFFSCDSSDDYPEDSLNIYQQYEVFIQDGSKAGFANFYINSPEGERFRLVGDAKVTVNDVKMLYSPSVSATYPEFNYSNYIDVTDQRAIFKFYRNNDKVLTNSVSFENMACAVLPPETNTIKLGQQTPYDINGILQPDEKVAVSLVPLVTSSTPQTYNAATSPFGQSFTILDIPEGVYTIRLDVVKTLETQQNDGNASGRIRVVRRKSFNEIKITK
ncbi:MAG: hypothetical protein NC201_04585 [Prevotella sp.]|nr:hypothetical protein [Bacteroides sp.]MCM1366506.1 hypothetical protein [Prevotella sp.]MCM1436845.1 hypothetical protein [Prevotella sp.]